MPPTQPAKQIECPACHTPLEKGVKHCPECGMEVAKMKEYILAMQHAKKRAAESGTATQAPLTVVQKLTPFGDAERVDVEEIRASMKRQMLKVGMWVFIAIVVITGTVWSYRAIVGPGEPWRRYPKDPRVLLTTFFKIIHTDTLKEHAKAYDLISLLRKDEKDSTQRDQYMQLFHDVHSYYSTLFGNNYINEIRFEPENNDADHATTWIATIRTETMTIDIEPQTPADKRQAGEPERWGVVAIREFPLGNSARGQQMKAIGGILEGLGAGGSRRQLEGIAGYGADLSRMSPAEIKQMLLPLIANPRGTALTQNIYRTWVVRKDPTVREALENITKDTRYGETDRNAAREVLNDKVPEEVLIGVGITNTD